MSFLQLITSIRIDGENIVVSAGDKSISLTPEEAVQSLNAFGKVYAEDQQFLDSLLADLRQMNAEFEMKLKPFHSLMELQKRCESKNRLPYFHEIVIWCVKQFWVHSVERIKFLWRKY